MKELCTLAAIAAVSSPAFAQSVSGTVNAELVRPTTGRPGAVLYSQSNNLPEAPTASGFGGVNNSLGQLDENLYGLSQSGTQSYGAGVAWGSASANSTVGDPFTFETFPGSGVDATVWGGGNAQASLDLDLTGAPLGSSVGALSNAGFQGFTYDGSDTAGLDGFYTFNVDFSINATVSGSGVEGAFGVQIDIFSISTFADLVPVDFTPRVSGDGISGTVDMVVAPRTDELGDAWTFALSADDIAAAGGSVNRNYTAEFRFAIPNDPATGNAMFLTIDAFAAASVPAPGATFMIGFAGLVACRRRR